MAVPPRATLLLQALPPASIVSSLHSAPSAPRQDSSASGLARVERNRERIEQIELWRSFPGARAESRSGAAAPVGRPRRGGPARSRLLLPRGRDAGSAARPL